MGPIDTVMVFYLEGNTQQQTDLRGETAKATKSCAPYKKGPEELD